MQWFSSSCKAQCNWLNTQTQKKGLNKSFAILSYSSFFGGGGVWASTCHITFVKHQQTQPTALLLKSNPGHFGGGHVPLPTLYNFIKVLYINCIKFKYAFLDILDEETNLNCVSQGSCIPVFFFLINYTTLLIHVSSLLFFVSMKAD